MTEITLDFDWNQLTKEFAIYKLKGNLILKKINFAYKAIKFQIAECYSDD